MGAAAAAAAAAVQGRRSTGLVAESVVAARRCCSSPPRCCHWRAGCRCSDDGRCCRWTAVALLLLRLVVVVVAIIMRSSLPHPARWNACAWREAGRRIGGQSRKQHTTNNWNTIIACNNVIHVRGICWSITEIIQFEQWNNYWNGWIMKNK